MVSSDLHFLSDFSEWKTDDIFASLHNVSKLMEIHIVRHFVSLYGTNYPVVFNTVQPGWRQSNLSTEIATLFQKKLESFMERTTEEGARSLVFATSFGKKSLGKYVENGGLLSRLARNCGLSYPAGWRGFAQTLWRDSRAFWIFSRGLCATFMIS
ncbi:putative short-chain dehydrogenase reductase protein [Botrytis fragariae]|uniref:Putative short-chain dehydrogenase reductase protein n=1 Tax=Botrytis fragariae TaxID=1964551 RepID=A0A8H6EDN1_9HELO|nr:putative short-chain dehydrogenase reductase protein [Botrytis fragariae]KAF5868472.1 putative short-chain dehydrogenase reductase protein [Botrytis fragariae]